MFNWFFKKKEIEQIKKDTKNSFDLVKKDFEGVGKWIGHLNSTKEIHRKEIDGLKAILLTAKKDIDDLRNVLFLSGNFSAHRIPQTPKQVFKKQTAVGGVQTAVQTGIQTPFFGKFSASEKSTLWVLLNTDMKLSYEDIAVVLGKEKTTIRGQINSMKQKQPEIISEIIEKNGKKRFFLPEKIKEKLLKKQKMSVKRRKS